MGMEATVRGGFDNLTFFKVGTLAILSIWGRVVYFKASPKPGN